MLLPVRITDVRACKSEALLVHGKMLTVTRTGEHRLCMIREDLGPGRARVCLSGSASQAGQPNLNALAEQLPPAHYVPAAAVRNVLQWRTSAAVSCAVQVDGTGLVPNPPVREPTLAAGFATPRLADFRPVDSGSRCGAH